MAKRKSTENILHWSIMTGLSITDDAVHRSRIRYLSEKKSRILTNFPKLKKIVKTRKKIR